MTEFAANVGISCASPHGEGFARPTVAGLWPHVTVCRADIDVDHFSIETQNGKIYNRLVSTISEPRRRWYQCSLRTLLVLMLLACIGMSYIAVKMQPFRKQHEAVEAIERLGGSVAWGYPLRQGESRGRAWLRKLVGDDVFAHPKDITVRNDAGTEYLTELTQVPCLHLIGTQITDAGLEHIKGLTHLRDLMLVNTQVSNSGLEHLKGLTQLQGLSLDSTQVTDVGLEHLKGLTQLQWLSLGYTRVTDVGLEHLKGLTQLQQVSLEGTQVTDACLEHLQGLTQLRVLSLEGTQVTDAGLEHLQGLTQLQTLLLEGTQVTDAGLEHLTGLAQLSELGLTDTQVSDSGVRRLQQALPDCQIHCKFRAAVDSVRAGGR